LRLKDYEKKKNNQKKVAFVFDFSFDLPDFFRQE
jgi:hypothetical protein